MLRPLFAPSRIAALAIIFFVTLVLVLSATSSPTSGVGSSKAIHKIKETAQSAANNICNNDSPLFGRPTISDSFRRLYGSILHPISSHTYTDANDKVFEIKEDADAPWWDRPLGKDVLIVDIDTRMPNGTNELWNEAPLNWEKMMDNNGDGGMISASFMNHFLYSQIHGYDYRFFNAHELKGLHNTWVKPHVLLELLHSYRFVIFIDGDATIRHLEVPFEWMFNRWGVTPHTSIAMPLDVRFVKSGDKHASEDSKGKLVLNTGVVVAQALPHTFELLKAWKDCPSEQRYPGCGAWKETWSHEQRAFSEYIRYDFNPTGSEIVDIPCNDAMGYPGLIDQSWMISNCTGQFIRHHTINKDMTKRDSEIAMLQSLTDLTHKVLMDNKKKYWIEEL